MGCSEVDYLSGARRESLPREQLNGFIMESAQLPESVSVRLRLAFSALVPAGLVNTLNL